MKALQTFLVFVSVLTIYKNFIFIEEFYGYVKNV